MLKRSPAAVVFIVVAAVSALLVMPRPALAVADRLPDLGMGQLGDLSIDTTTIPGHRLLRFRTVIANVGIGPLETIGARSDTTVTEMTVRQRIYDDAGSYRDVNTPAVMFYAGDGHNHWHVRDAEAYELLRLDNGSKVGVGAKHGFCYFDNTRYRLSLPRAPSDPVYTGCGTQGDLTVTTGISVGWGDTYPAFVPFQYIDVTGLKFGRYRLRATADPQDWFAETNNGNNSTWVDIHLTNSAARIVANGPVI